MMFSSGYELTTGITNIFIVIAALIAFFKTKEKYWKIFFLLVAIDGSLGVTIHCFIHTELTKKILWGILTFTFAFTVNTLLLLFLRFKYNKLNMLHVSILSILLYIVLILEVIYNKDYLLTFILYALLVIMLITVIIIKSGIKENKYYLLAIICQYIGGIPMLIYKHLPKIPVIDQNGFYHLFMVISVLFFYLQNKDKKN